MTHRRTIVHFTLLVALLLNALPWGGAQAAPVRRPAPGVLYVPLPLKTMFKTAAYSPSTRPSSAGANGLASYSSSKVPAEGKFVTRGGIGLEETYFWSYSEACAHNPGLTFAWNG